MRFWKVRNNMATRNMLHISKLKDFELFLVNKGYAIVETSNNPYEILRAKKDKDTVVIYQKANTREHLSVMDKDVGLVNDFLYGEHGDVESEYCDDFCPISKAINEYNTTHKHIISCPTAMCELITNVVALNSKKGK